MPTEEMNDRAAPQSPDVSSRAVLTSIAGFLVFVAMTMAGLLLYMKAEAPDALRRVVERRFPSPVLQRSPRDDLKQFELTQRMALSGYRWVDRSSGIVQIPIEDAKRIVEARGSRAYEPYGSSTVNSTNKSGARP